MKVIITSGYFNPIHTGHINLLREARELGDLLVVIVNNDKQVGIKGSSKFMPEQERLGIVESIRYVDEVFLSIDKYKWPNGAVPVIKSLAKVKPDIFANGGDRKSFGDVPEYDICRKLKIKMVDGLGKKIRASSTLIAEAAKKTRLKNNLCLKKY